MKKYLIIITALILTSSVSFGQNIKKPNVKKITVHRTDFEEGSGKPVIDKMTSFDMQGNIIEEKNFKDGEIRDHFSYKYDQMGNKTEEIEYDKKGKIKKTIQFKYKNNLRIERIIMDGKGKIKSKKTYEYEMY